MQNRFTTSLLHSISLLLVVSADAGAVVGLLSGGIISQFSVVRGYSPRGYLIAPPRVPGEVDVKVAILIIHNDRY